MPTPKPPAQKLLYDDTARPADDARRDDVARNGAPSHADAAANQAKPNGRAPELPRTLALPYADFSHALIRAHHDAHAMIAANRHLAEALRSVVRRQQDLAFELAEAAIGAARGGAVAAPTEIFDRAAQAVREVGEAIIDAQISALRRLQSETGTQVTAAFAFPPVPSEIAVPAAAARKDQPLA